MNSIDKIYKLKKIFKRMEYNFSFLPSSALKEVGRLLYESEDISALIRSFDRNAYMRNIENESKSY